MNALWFEKSGVLHPIPTLPVLADLIQTAGRVTLVAMHLLLAIAVYLIMGAILGLGILLAVEGSFWLLIASLLFYIVAFARLGCLHH